MRDRHNRTALELLLEEFAGDLAFTPAERGYVDQVVVRTRRWWNDGRPQGVAEPLAEDCGTLDVEARAAGARAAAEEWARGEVLLYRHGEERADGHRPACAIPIVWFPRADAPAKQRIAGHNAEVWRRLRADGPPKGSPLTWLPVLFDLPRAWRDGGETVRLRMDQPRAQVPHLGLVTLEPWHDALTISVNGGSKLSVPPLCGCRPYVDARPGLPESGVLLVRTRVDYPDERPVRLYAIDARTGSLLNAQAARR
jgi:hypothetical protein